MQTTLTKISSDVSKPKKKLNLLVRSDTYAIDGDWNIADETSFVGTVADLNGFTLTFNYLINLDGTNNLVHPDDLVATRTLLEDLKSGKTTSFQIRIITATGAIRVLDGAGKLVGINNTSIADLDETTSQKELELSIFKHAEQVAHIGAWTWNLASDKFYCTENTYRILGLSAPAAIDFSALSQLIHFEDRERIMHEFFEMKHQKKDVDVSFRILLPTGELRYLKIRAELFTTRNGTQYFIGAIQDVTHESEQTRLLSEKGELHLQNVLDAIPQMVWVLDINGTVKFGNDRFYSYTGLTPEQCKRSQAKKFDIFHPSQRKEVEHKWQELTSTKKSYVGEVLIRNEKGEYRWHLDITEPILDQHGNVEMWVGTFTDVHEEFVQEKQAKETKDLLEAVFNASANGIAVFDAVYDDNHYIVDFIGKLANQQAQEFTTATPGTSLRQFFEKSRAESFIEILRQVILTGETAEFDCQLQRSDTEVWYHAVAVKLEDSVVLTLEDITERVRAKQNLLKLNETLRQKNFELKGMNEEITNFAFIASHDLREPLRKIQLFTGLLLDKEAAGAGTKTNLYLAKIQGAVFRMNALIDDVLAYSKASIARPPKNEVVDLNGVLHQVLNELSETIHERKALISQNKMPVFKCNVLQISQLLQNLIDNALKFQSGDKIPKIEITAQIVAGETIGSTFANPELNYLKLEVSDNGIGFEQQYAEKIFGMFQRLHGRAAFPGTGMGLAICKKVVENHKGFIVARSVPGEGATFTCYMTASA